MANNDYSDLGGQQEHDYSDLGGTVDNQPSLLEQINQSAPMQYVHGMQYGTTHLAPIMTNLLAKRLQELGKPFYQMAGMPQNIPQQTPDIPQQGSGIAYEAGKPLGEVAGIAGMSELGGAGGLPSALSNVGTMAGYGALQNPEDRATGALKGAAYGSLGETLPMIKGMNIIPDAIRPQLIAKSLADQLSDKNIAAKKNYGGQLYDSVFRGSNNLGRSPLYNGDLATSSENTYASLDPSEKSDAFDADTKKMDRKFYNNPTIQNAHELQSQMGERIRDLMKLRARQGGLGQVDNNQLISIKTAQGLLQNDIISALNKQDPNAANQYNQAAANWATNVAPYNDAATLMKSLGDNPSPEKIIDKFQKAGSKGFSIHPELAEQLAEMQKRVSNKNIVQALSGGGLGYAASHISGGSIPSEILSALAGGSLSSPIMKAIASRFSGARTPSNGFLQALGQTLQKTYTPAYQAGAIGLLNQGQ